MKILAIENEKPGVHPDQYQPHLRAEAARVWELYQAGLIREHYFNPETHAAVLILECTDASEAQAILDSLPLVQAGLIEFEILPLVPYPGYARLFSPSSE